MANKSLKLSDRLYRYLRTVSVREPPVLRRLRQATAREPAANMQIAPEQGQFMALLVQVLGAKKTLEIGVFTGYSALWVALALPAGGRIVACDVSETWTKTARRFWTEAGVAGKIDLRLAPAINTLDGLILEGQAGSFDFAFIDADKVNYDSYYERTLKLLRPGGLCAIDNVLWGGAVVDKADRSKDTAAIRALNKKLHGDSRIDLSLVPIGDGLTLARKL